MTSRRLNKILAEINNLVRVSIYYGGDSGGPYYDKGAIEPLKMGLTGLAKELGIQDRCKLVMEGEYPTLVEVEEFDGKTFLVDKKVTHQGIGGRPIRIEFAVSADDVFDKAMSGNPACFNFVHRRDDFNYNGFPHRLFYGKVGGLGYVVSEDELLPMEEADGE